MLNWKVSKATLLILSGMAFVMLLIVVLPDVDLPDTAFHRRTAPVLVHAHANSVPPATAFASGLQIPEEARTFQGFDLRLMAYPPNLNFRPILLCSLRC